MNDTKKYIYKEKLILIRIKDSTRHKLKIQAAKEGITLLELVERKLNE